MGEQQLHSRLRFLPFFLGELVGSWVVSLLAAAGCPRLGRITIDPNTFHNGVRIRSPTVHGVVLPFLDGPIRRAAARH